MDEVEAPFESILNWAAFSIRVKEASFPRSPIIQRRKSPLQRGIGGPVALF